MTDTTEAPALPPDRFRLSEWHTNWIASNWDITDLTDGEHRCLWVLERYLAESNHRFYHLDHPGIRRMRWCDGFESLTFGGVDSWDSTGLAALTICAFAAAVRVEIRTTAFYYDAEDDEPSTYWDEADVPRRHYLVTYRTAKGFDGEPFKPPRYPYTTTSRFTDEAERDEHIAFLKGVGRHDEFDADYDPEGCDIHEVKRLSIMLTARNPDAPSIVEGHPGLDYLTKMIDRVKAGDPTPGVPT